MCYNTNLTDSQWQIIAEVLEDGRKRQYSLQVIVNALLYVTKTGCQWRNLPKDFPKWQLVYYYFRKWSRNGLISKMHQILYQKVRIKEKRAVSPSLGLLDSQSVNSASLTIEKGLDANKKINGRKRFIVTDTLGWIMALMVGSGFGSRARRSRKIMRGDGGQVSALEKGVSRSRFFGRRIYSEEYILRIEKRFGFVFEIVKKMLGVSGFQVLPKRWVVERRFG